MIYMLSANSKNDSLRTNACKCCQMSAYLFKIFQKILCALKMLCCFSHNGTVNFIDFCPCIFNTLGPLPCRPRMCAAKITIFPIVNRRHLQIIIMNKRQYLLVCPIRHRAVSCYSLLIGINVISLTNIVSVSSPPSKKQHIQLILFIIFCLSSMLDNLEPLGCIFAILRKKHMRMSGQPFHILFCIDYR